MKQGNKFRTIALLGTASALIGMGSAYAATTTVTSTIRFITDITLTKVADPDFGWVKAATAGTYIMDTTGAITGTGVKEGGTPVVGNYTIAAGAAEDPLEIYFDTYAANGATTPSAAVCSYNAGAPAPCNLVGGALIVPKASVVASAALKFGLTLTATASGADGQTDSPTMQLNVIYQ